MLKITLEAARKNAGMSRESVANAVGVSYSTIKSWEKGRTFPNQPQIDKLCELYGLTYDSLNFLPKKLT